VIFKRLCTGLLSSGWTWAITAAIVLSALNGYWLVQFVHVQSPPLPDGDGPDYESLAYSLSTRNVFEFAWEDPNWQEPYRTAQLADGSLKLEYTQINRRDWPGPTASRPPALPYMIRLVYDIIPRGPIAFSCVRWLSCAVLTLAGVQAVLLTQHWASNLFQHMASANHHRVYFVALACATALLLAMMDKTIKTYLQDFLTEPWGLLGVTSLIWCLVRWVEAPGRMRWMILSGVIFAIMILFRSLFVFWLPTILVGIALSNRKAHVESPRWWLAPVVFCMAVCLIAGPWWVRNILVSGRWMPMGTQGAASLRGGYSDQALADWGNWHADAEAAMQSKLDRESGSDTWSAIKREVALADLASQETWNWIHQHRADLVKLGFMRLVSHWGPWRIDHILWKAAAILGLIAIWRTDPPLGLILASIFFADAFTTILLYETGGRFLIPLHGCLYSLAGVGVAFCIASAIGNPVHPGDEHDKLADESPGCI